MFSGGCSAAQVFRVPLDYSVVEVGLTTASDRSDCFRVPGFTGVFAAAVNAHGDHTLDSADMATFVPQLGTLVHTDYFATEWTAEMTTDVQYNVTLQLHTERNLSAPAAANLSTVEAVLRAELGDANRTERRFNSSATPAQTVQAVQLLRLTARPEIVDIVPEPEPEPFIVPADAYTCTCPHGWTNGFCEYDFIGAVAPDCGQRKLTCSPPFFVPWQQTVF